MSANCSLTFGDWCKSSSESSQRPCTGSTLSISTERGVSGSKCTVRHRRRKWLLFVLWKANPASSLAKWNVLLLRARYLSHLSWIAFHSNEVSGDQNSDLHHSLGQFQRFDGQSEYSSWSHLASWSCSIDSWGTHRAVFNHTHGRQFSSIPQIVSSTLPQSIVVTALAIYHSTTLLHNFYFFLFRTS